MLNRHSGGFVLIEFAIALPLLILLGYGLAIIGVKIFQVGKTQLADYVLEAEAQYVMERITHQARAAKEIEVHNTASNIQWIGIVYHTAADDPVNEVVNVANVRETQYFMPHMNNSLGIYDSINAKRTTSNLNNPITGGNSFGETRITLLKFRELKNNVLHITLEMESLVTKHKIKFDTAVFMPGCNVKDGLPRE